MRKISRIDDRIRDGDRTLFTLFGQEFTINEVHSIAIGAAIGLIIGERGISLHTLLNEPHYALVAFAVAHVLGRRLPR